MMEYLVNGLEAKLYANRGYISHDLKSRLKDKGIDLMTYHRKNMQSIQELGENDDFIEEIFEDVAETVGIKTHVCVLTAMGSTDWEEVYVHSKVTIINDVFLTMGSANINTRSMQVDTEFNIAMEHGEKVKQLRKDLWGLHSDNDIKLNPEDMYLNTEAESAFDAWGEQLDQNVKLKEQNQKPFMPLTPFLRMDPTVSVYD